MSESSGAHTGEQREQASPAQPEGSNVMSDISPSELARYEVIAAEYAELHAAMSEQPPVGGDTPQVCFTTTGESVTADHFRISPAYHINTRPADGSVALLLDPGSVGNLCGDKWA